MRSTGGYKTVTIHCQLKTFPRFWLSYFLIPSSYEGEKYIVIKIRIIIMKFVKLQRNI